jgi:hypothetical protein
MENASVKIDIKGPYWLTRDRKNGELSETVEVWLAKPDLRRFEDGDVMWLPNLDLVDEEVTHYAEWTIQQCLKECHVYPETERECIRVG